MKKTRALLWLAGMLLTAVLYACPVPARAQTVDSAAPSYGAELQPDLPEEIPELSVSLDTRSVQITVPALITLDARADGGSGLYTYTWTVRYTDTDEELYVSDEQGEYSSHKEISILKTGDFVVTVKVTDKINETEGTASTEVISALDRYEWQWDPSLEQDAIDAYYTALIGHLSNADNPLEDEAFRGMINRRLVERNFTDGQIASIIYTLTNAETLYRDLYLLSFYDYTMSGMQGTGSNYSKPPNSVYISSTISTHNFSETFFHESAHGIHMNKWNLIEHPFSGIRLEEGWRTAAEPAGNTAIEEKVLEALAQDVRSAIVSLLEEMEPEKLTPQQREQIADALVNGDPEVTETILWWTETVHASVRGDSVLREYYIKVRDELSRQISRIPYSNATMVCDIYGGMTNNKLKLPYGHPGDYWYTGDGEINGMQLCEAWAEFFSAQIRHDTYNIEMNEQYFPTASRALEELAERLRQNYLEYYYSLYGETGEEW